jgi:hypothetical protein
MWGGVPHKFLIFPITAAGNNVQESLEILSKPFALSTVTIFDRDSKPDYCLLIKSITHNLSYLHTFFTITYFDRGHAVAKLVEGFYYKPEGCRFNLQ